MRTILISICQIVLLYGLAIPVSCETTANTNPYFERANLNAASPEALTELGVSMGAEETKFKGGCKPTIVKDGPAIPVYFASASDKYGHFGIASKATGDYHDAQVKANIDDLTGQINKYLNTNKKANLLVFVHGCCQDFPCAYSSAAELARESKMPVLLYSWLSVPYHVTGPLTTIASHAGYSENEANCEVSQSMFRDFFTSLESRISYPNRVVLIAHSMGNRLLTSELEFRHEITKTNPSAKQFKAVIFACADVPAQAFIKNKSAIAANCTNTWVLKNNIDAALDASSKVHNGRRLGNPNELVEQIKGNGVVVVDIQTVRGKEHAMPYAIITSLINGNKRAFQDSEPSLKIAK
ncbi:alpha/beta hydrolase [bacterium]|nr:alpha/beta hydrolase [bacterium]